MKKEIPSPPRRKVGRPKGTPKSGGRKKGTPNKITTDVKEHMAEMLRNTQGWEHLESDFASGTLAAPVFSKILDHVLGKPKESVSTDVTGELHIVHELPDDD